MITEIWIHRGFYASDRDKWAVDIDGTRVAAFSTREQAERFAAPIIERMWAAMGRT